MEFLIVFLVRLDCFYYGYSIICKWFEVFDEFVEKYGIEMNFYMNKWVFVEDNKDLGCRGYL